MKERDSKVLPWSGIGKMYILDYFGSSILIMEIKLLIFFYFFLIFDWVKILLLKPASETWASEQECFIS